MPLHKRHRTVPTSSAPNASGVSAHSSVPGARNQRTLRRAFDRHPGCSTSTERDRPGGFAGAGLGSRPCHRTSGAHRAVGRLDRSRSCVRTRMKSQQFWRDLRRSSEEDQIAYRKGERYVVRLRTVGEHGVSVPARASRRCLLRADRRIRCAGLLDCEMDDQPGRAQAHPAGAVTPFLNDRSGWIRNCRPRNGASLPSASSKRWAQPI